MSVTVGAEHFDQLVADFQHGDVERSTTQVEDRDLLILLLFQTVSQSGRGWLIDDSRNFQTSDLASVFRRLSLSIVEVSGDGDDRLVYLVAKVAFC